MKTAATYILSNKPYFGYEFFSQQGVLDRHTYFLPLIKYYKNKIENNEKIDILEIGSYAGASAITFADGCKQLNIDFSVTCVDMWEAYFDENIDKKDVYSEMNKALEDDLIFNLFLHNIKSSGYSDKISYEKGDSTKVLPSMNKKEFGIIYIDGCHTFNIVTEDIINAKKLIKDGGIICGDDLEVLKKNISDIEKHNELIKNNQDFGEVTLSDETIAEYHPGVAEAVDLHFESVSLWNGFWAVQYNNGKYEEINLNLDNLILPKHLKDFQGDTYIEMKNNKIKKDIKLIEESVEGYNIVLANNIFLAVQQSLGAIDFSDSFFTRQELYPYIIHATSIEKIKERIKYVQK